MKYKLILIFRKPGPEFNSIENVFNALLPYFGEEFEVKLLHLPYRTSGVFKMRRNYNFLRQQNPEGIVHVTGHDNYMVMAADGPTVLTLHDIHSAFTGRGLRDRYIKRHWMTRPIRTADRVTVISEFSAGEICKMFPESRDKITVIPNPVDDRINYSEKDFNESNPLILLIGTKPNKNLERSIEALRGLACRAVIIGKLTPKQERLLQESSIRFQNLHSLSYEEVLEQYKASDILLFPSTYEGFGMPILEGQATGRPVITSNRGAMKEAAGDGALLVDPENPDAIRKAVEQVIADRELRTSLIQKGLQNAEKYGAKRIAQQYMNLYREVISGH